ncbi:MAG: Nramp family divalent metal transporter [Bacteroidia bacterium]|nr:Nramp family divalent metal transporter [Bacteroidia bacterium]
MATTTTETLSAIKQPPVRLIDKLKFLGPGFILTASIVGSGELIATTTLGAEAGFVTFWVILVSCAVKVAIQLEFGKHAIYSGETVMEAFNKLPGLRLGKAHWTIWAYLVLMLTKFLQVGGIIGGVALTMNIAFPQINVPIWTFAIAILSSLMVFRGHYRFIEGASLAMIGLFTLFTFACLFFLQYTPYAISLSQVAEGLTFKLPVAAIAVAIGAFGLTGVGGDEILFYNYWCLEKGYARYTGPREDSEEWVSRAKGWINVMYLDAVLAMALYTSVTAAFYLLGAAVLHATGDIPKGYAMVETLSTMYTEALGPWARSIFLIGAVAVLFSTLFSALASWIRIYGDAFSQIGWVDYKNPVSRSRILAVQAWVIPMVWAILFLGVGEPVFMVLTGGVITSVILFMVVYVAVYFRIKQLPVVLLPGKIYNFAFGLSVISIGWVGVYGLIKVIRSVMGG